MFVLNFDFFRKKTRRKVDALSAASCVFALLEQDLKRGMHSQYSYFISKSWPNGFRFKQVKMVNYPAQSGIGAGIDYIRSYRPKPRFWAFGLIIGARGNDTDLAIYICCGGRDIFPITNIIRELTNIDGQFVYKKEAHFWKSDEGVQHVALTAQEQRELETRYGRNVYTTS